MQLEGAGLLGLTVETTEHVVADEARALISALGTTSTNNDICVFYVNRINRGTDLSLSGYALAQFWYPSSSEASYLNNAFVRSDSPTYTLAHELAHLLVNQQHSADEYGNYDGEIFNLLSVNGSESTGLHGMKRLRSEQAARILASPLTQ